MSFAFCSQLKMNSLSPKIEGVQNKKEEGNMKKTLRIIVFVGLSAALLAGSAYAASDAKNLTVNANVAARAKLALSVSAINFPDADPDSTPSIAATEGAVSVTASVRTGTGTLAYLDHLAAGDLVSGSDAITITNVSWTATGTGFSSGAMSKTNPGTRAGGWAGSGVRSGTFTYSFANSWSYATGNYTASSTYTLTAP